MRGRPAQRGGAILLLLVLGGGAILAGEFLFTNAVEWGPGTAFASVKVRWARSSPQSRRRFRSR